MVGSGGASEVISQALQLMRQKIVQNQDGDSQNESLKVRISP